MTCYLKINNLTKRYDVVVYKPDGNINVLVECKAPEVKITQGTFDQIARYNMTLNADYLMVTNGLNHYFCKMDYENEKYQLIVQPLMNYPYLQLYTPADRKSIAIENLSGIPNCFNNKIGLQLMKPHQNLVLKTSYQFIIK